MPKKEKKKTIEGQILSKLENMEKRFAERISNIETSLKRIDESSILATDDQLFFGFVFSLALLILTLPEFDVCTLFESFGFKIEGTSATITTKNVTVVTLIIASIARYFVTFVKGDVKKNKLRIFSVNFLIASFYMLMLDFFIRGLGSVFGNLHWLLMILAPMLFVFLAVLFGFFVEKKWYQHYYNSHDPVISLTFAFVGLFVLVAYVLSMFVALFITFSGIVPALIFVASLIIVVLALLLGARVEKRLTKRKSLSSP
jgi:hypothetical protein